MAKEGDKEVGGWFIGAGGKEKNEKYGTKISWRNFSLMSLQVGKLPTFVGTSMTSRPPAAGSHSRINLRMRF